MAEQVKEALRARDSAKASLKTTEKQVEEIRKELHYSEINLATEKQMVTSFAKNFARPGRLPNYSRRQLRPRSRLHMTWEYRKLKAVSQRSFLLWRGTTAISPRVKPWMSLESLLIPTWGGLRAYIMTRTSVSSQVLALLPQNILPKCLRCP